MNARERGRSANGAQGLAADGEDLVRSRYHAHHDVQDAFGGQALWMACIALALIVGGLLADSDWSKIAWIGAGAVLLAACRGIWTAREWARIVSGVIAVLVGSAGLWELVAGTRGKSSSIGGAVIQIAIQLITGLVLLSPGTKARFRRAREARALARAAKARADR